MLVSIVFNTIFRYTSSSVYQSIWLVNFDSWRQHCLRARRVRQTWRACKTLLHPFFLHTFWHEQFFLLEVRGLVVGIRYLKMLTSYIFLSSALNSESVSQANLHFSGVFWKPPMPSPTHITKQLWTHSIQTFSQVSSTYRVVACKQQTYFRSSEDRKCVCLTRLIE